MASLRYVHSASRCEQSITKLRRVIHGRRAITAIEGREELRNGCVIMRGRVLSTSGELKHSSLTHDEATCAEYILHPLFLAHLYLNSTALQVHATKTDRSRKENEGFSIWCHCNAAAFILRACIFNRWPIPIDAFVAPTATRPYFRHGPWHGRALIWRIAMRAEQMRSPLSTNLLGLVCRSDRRQTGRRPHHHLICHVSLSPLPLSVLRSSLNM